MWHGGAKVMKKISQLNWMKALVVKSDLIFLVGEWKVLYFQKKRREQRKRNEILRGANSAIFAAPVFRNRFPKNCNFELFNLTERRLYMLANYLRIWCLYQLFLPPLHLKNVHWVLYMIMWSKACQFRWPTSLFIIPMPNFPKVLLYSGIGRLGYCE